MWTQHDLCSNIKYLPLFCGIWWVFIHLSTREKYSTYSVTGIDSDPTPLSAMSCRLQLLRMTSWSWGLYQWGCNFWKWPPGAEPYTLAIEGFSLRASFMTDSLRKKLIVSHLRIRKAWFFFLQKRWIFP